MRTRTFGFSITAAVLVVVLVGIFIPTLNPFTSGNLPNSEKQYNYLNPSIASSAFVDKVLLDEDFQTDPFAPSGNWDSVLFHYSATEKYAYADSMLDTNIYDCYMTYRYSLRETVNFTNAKFTVHWAGYREHPWCTNEDRWQYKVGEGAWIDFTAPGTYRTGNFDVTFSFDLNGAYLPNNGENFSIRCYARVQSFWDMSGWWYGGVNIYSVRMQLFNASISDNGPITSLEVQDLRISANFSRAVKNSTYNASWDNYRLYYNLNNLDVQSSTDYVLTDGAMVIDDYHYSMNYTISASSFTAIGTLYYALRIEDPTVPGQYIWDITGNTTVTDIISPFFTGVMTINATNFTLEVGQSLLLSGVANDSGGSGLRNITLYWRVGSNDVSNLTYDGWTYTYLAGTGMDYQIELPAVAFQANTWTYFILYLFDNCNNSACSTIKSIKPGDFDAPQITPLNDITSTINYLTNKDLEFQINDDPKGWGLAESGVKCFYNINDENIATASIAEQTYHADTNWTFRIMDEWYAYTDQVYVWVKAPDNFNNIAYYNFSFQVIDTELPIMNLLSATFVNKNSIEILVHCEDTLGGSNIDNLTLAISQEYFEIWPSSARNWTLFEGEGCRYLFVIPASELFSGTVYYYIRGSDNSGNYIEIFKSITIDLSGDGTPNGDDEDPTMMFILFGGIIGGTGVGVVILIRKMSNLRRKII